MLSFASVLSTTVLLLGDSHTIGPFGQKLDQLMRAQLTQQLYTYASCGSTADWFLTGKNSLCGTWSSTPKDGSIFNTTGATPIAGQLITRFKPKMTIVALGTNYATRDLKNPDQRTAIKNEMSELAKLIRKSGSVCFWVSLPDTKTFKKKQQDIVMLTQESVSSSCTVIDSLKISNYPNTCSDGIHYNCADGINAANGWAKKVFEIILSALK
jgi:hypothetical protein